MQTNAKTLSDVPAINRFLSYCRVRTVPSKTVMIHAGDLPDVLYYIVDGSVEVMIEDEDGNEMVLAYLNKGQFFGEMGLFYEQPTRSAWVRTRTECEIAEMTYPRFRQIASESPGLVFELATQLATRLDRTNRKLGDLAFVDVTGRVAHAIMDLCNEPDAMTHPDGMQIKVSRQESRNRVWFRRAARRSSFTAPGPTATSDCRSAPRRATGSRFENRAYRCPAAFSISAFMAVIVAA
jgi:CRP/FNR family cyclic AMP-dependent transcriptional regulator